LAFTQNGTFIVISFILCIAAFSIFGILHGYTMYKGIKDSYQQQSE